MKPRDVIKKVLADGWYELPRGSTAHRQYGHATKPGKVTVTIKGGREYADRNIRDIIKQMGITKAIWEKL